MKITADDALSGWKKLLEHVREEGEALQYRDRGTIECLNVLTEIQSTEKIEEPIAALNSLGDWVYPSLEEISDSLLSDEETDYVYTYGLRLFQGKNQVDDYLIPLLEEKPESGRGVVLSWDVDEDSDSGVQEAPGIVSFDFKLREELNVTAVIRNNNIFFGWPANIYQAYILQRYVAKELNVEQGTLSTLSCSAHIYEDELPHVEEIVGGED